MYKVDLPVNHAAEEAVARRRAAEVARKARIFNTRSRVLGVDLSALDQQVGEKKLRQKVERQREEAFDELRRSHEEALLQQARAEEERRAALNRDLIQYRTVHQRMEDSRDADLICDLRGALGPTIPEEELGPASMQVFQGEDIGEKERKRMQMENTERELRGQKEVDEKRRVEDKYKEVLIGKEMVHQDLRMVQLDALEAECNKAARIALNNYNHALAAGQAEKLRERRTREEGEGLAEMWHMVTSDMLTECAEAAEKESGGGPGRPRVLTDRWRGMSAEQLGEILREREDQRLERQKQLEAEKLLDAAWDFQRMKLTREAEEEEMRTEELQRETRTQMDQYNKQLAKEQQTYQEYLNKKLYTNKPTANFFNQFNTSSR